MQRSSQTSRQALLDGFGTLIGDDEHGGACGRVRCIGAHSVRAAKQWVPEDGSKIKSWLALRNHRTSWWLSLSDSTMLHSWSFTAGSCARTASGEAASLKRHHRRDLTSRSTWATANHGPFNKRGPGHEFSIASRVIGPALPKLPDLVDSGKALKADPGKRRSTAVAAKRTAFGVDSGCKRRLGTCEAPVYSSTSAAAARLQCVRSCAKEFRCCGCYSNADGCSLEMREIANNEGVTTNLKTTNMQ